MAVDGVGAQANELCTTLGELRLELGESTELGGADRSVVLRVREQDNPVVTDELMEVDWAVGGLGLEVGGSAAETEARTEVMSAPETQAENFGANTKESCHGGVRISLWRELRDGEEL